MTGLRAWIKPSPLLEDINAAEQFSFKFGLRKGKKKSKVQEFNMQFKSWLNQISLSHKSNKKDKKRKTKQKTDE